MAEAFLALCRFIEYAGAMILFGSPLLLLYGSPFPAYAPASYLKEIKRLLSVAAIGVLIATVLGFIAQTLHLAGSLALALEPETLRAALWDMAFGRSSVVRLLLALLAIIAVMILPGSKPLWWVSVILGAGTCASFAWMGHGAATEGNIGKLHLAGDMAHILAAAGWIGALAVFCMVLAGPPSDHSAQRAICNSLASFSGAGTAFVAVIVASGLVNSAFLTGWDVGRIVSTTYGQVLIAKLVLFALMLVLAAYNRFRHTPALANALRNSGPSDQVMGDLRYSVLAETCIAGAVLVLVGWLGMLEPVTA